MTIALQCAKICEMRIPDWNHRHRRKRRLPGRDLLAWLNAQRGAGGKGLSQGFVPVEPNGPKDLFGGAVVDPYGEAT